MSSPDLPLASILVALGIDADAYRLLLARVKRQEIEPAFIHHEWVTEEPGDPGYLHHDLWEPYAPELTPAFQDADVERYHAPWDFFTDSARLFYVRRGLGGDDSGGSSGYYRVS